MTEFSDDNLIPDKDEQLGSSPDPRLRSFLRQAAAIIAADRGLSDSSRAKLQVLATRLELPDETFHLAIEQLQSSTEDSASLNHWEKSFVAFLEKEFNKVKSGILTVRMENRAINLANKKYGIPEIRAQQLIQKTAQHANIGSISVEDAEYFGNRLIADTIGRRDCVDELLQAELYRIGQKWGLDENAVDDVIDQTIHENVRRTASPPRRSWLAGASILLALIALAIGIAWYNDWLPIPLTQGESDVVQPKTNQSTGEPQTPPWWDDRVSALVDDLSQNSPKFAAIKTQLESPDVERREVYYRDLVETSLAAAKDETKINELIVHLYLLDPADQPTQAILELVRLAIPAKNVGQEVSERLIRRGIHANHLLAKLLYTPAGSALSADAAAERREPVEKLANSRYSEISTDVGAQQFGRLADRQLMVLFWNRLIRSSYADAARSAEVIEPLSGMSIAVLPRDIHYQLESQAVRSILEADASQWSNMKDAIARCIKRTDSVQVIEWINTFRSSTDRDLGDFLAQQLLERTGVQPESVSRAGIVDALVNYRTELRNQEYSEFVQRDSEIERVVNRIKNLIESDSNRTPQLIAQVGYGANLSLVFLREMQSQNGFRELDELLASSLPRLAELRLGIGQENQNADSPSTPTASEQRKFLQALDRLASLPDDRVAARITAWEVIAEIAHRFPNIEYADAVRLANYLLSEKEVREWLSIEQSLDHLSDWPMLKLAIADKTPESKVDLDQLLTIYQLLASESLRLESSGQVRDEIQQAFYQNALMTVAVRNRSNRMADEINWRKLEKWFQANESMRSRAMADAFDSDVTKTLPDTLRARANRDESSNSGRWIRAIDMAQTESGMARVILMNQIQIEMLAATVVRDIGIGASEMDQVMMRYRRSMKQDLTLGERLFWTEWALMHVSSMIRRHKLQSLLES